MSDNLLSLLRQKKVPDFQKFKEARRERMDFSRAASLYVKQQRGGKAS